ncbi:MAG: DUF1579 family protein [Phycisphaerae bacterium]
MKTGARVGAALSWLSLLVLSGCASPAAREHGPFVRPALQDDFLDHLVGRWHIARSIRGKVVENAMEARWVLQHQFVEMHLIDAATPPAYEATVYLGFDPDKARYVAHWCDNFGAGFSALGYGVRRGDSVEFRFEYDDGPFFNAFTWHADDDSWTFRGENAASDGSRKLFMEDRATRSSDRRE